MKIISGGSGEFGLFAFGEKSQAALNFLENQAYNFSNTLTQAGQLFMDKGREIFEKYNGSEALRLAKAAMRSVQYCFQNDSIRELKTIAEIQQAPLSMQRWVMACPEIRQLYHAQRCEGYSDTYVDMQPLTLGWDNYDYQKVMNGLLIDDEDADWKAINYYTHDDDDVKLTLIEQTDILSTWETLKQFLKEGKEDPTSPSCCKL